MALTPSQKHFKKVTEYAKQLQEKSGKTLHNCSVYNLPYKKAMEKAFAALGNFSDTPAGKAARKPKRDLSDKIIGEEHTVRPPKKKTAPTKEQLATKTARTQKKRGLNEPIGFVKGMSVNNVLDKAKSLHSAGKRKEAIDLLRFFNRKNGQSARVSQCIKDIENTDAMIKAMFERAKKK